MSESIKERKDIQEEFKWDLSSLYSSDEEWEKHLASMDEKVQGLKNFVGTLNTAENVKKYLDYSTQLSRELENLFGYASLRRSEDTREPLPQQMYARIYGTYITVITLNSFAIPEFLSLDEETIHKIVEDDLVKEYRFQLEQIVKQKPHTLSKEEEALLARFGEVIAAPGIISDNLMDADLVFEPVKDAEGNEIELTSANFILLQNSNDRILRENAFKSFYKTYKQHINTFASLYSANVKGAVAEAEVRHYNASREMSLDNNNIPLSVYDNLIDTVHKHMETMYRYVRLRKRLLGVEELHYYDLYTPLVQEDTKKYSYEDAQKVILEALQPMGSEYCETVKNAFQERWLDVYPNKGKSSGAYSSGTYDSNPFILTNFTGTLDSVSTIAHEMGHSMHSWYSKHNQPPQYADYTLFVAEVASTVNENLLIEYLMNHCEDPKEKLGYLNEYLEGFKGTVYRQTMFAEFEKIVHEKAQKGEPLDPQNLNGVYHDLIVKYFGDDLVLDEEVDYEWSRIPHFYRPFYVYVYATGYTSAVALSELILKDSENAKRYIEFLSMGGSKYPLDELRHAGVDLNTPEPIDIALNKFEKALEEAEKIADELGY